MTKLREKLRMGKKAKKKRKAKCEGEQILDVLRKNEKTSGDKPTGFAMVAFFKKGRSVHIHKIGSDEVAVAAATLQGDFIRRQFGAGMMDVTELIKDLRRD